MAVKSASQFSDWLLAPWYSVGMHTAVKERPDVGQSIARAKAWLKAHFAETEKGICNQYGCWGDPANPGDKAPGGGGEKPAGKPAKDPSSGQPALTPQCNWVQEIPPGILQPGHDQTWQDHFTGNPDPEVARQTGEPVGKPTPERQALHDSIKRDALDHVKPVAEGEKKIAIMSMGGPGSGKSTVLKAAGIDETRFVKVDPDGVKGSLPEYQKATAPDATYRGAALMAHEESSYVAKEIRDEAIATGKNVIIDGTCANAAKSEALIDHLKAQGYEVRLVMPHIEVEDAMQRVSDRAERSGRLVPEKIVRDNYAKIPQNFERLAAKADAAALFDNSSKPPPQLVMSRQNGQTVDHNGDFMAGFRARYTGAAARP